MRRVVKRGIWELKNSESETVGCVDREIRNICLLVLRGCKLLVAFQIILKRPNNINITISTSHVWFSRILQVRTILHYSARGFTPASPPRELVWFITDANRR